MSPLLAVAAALAADCDIAAALDAVRASGTREAYDCVTATDAGRDALVVAIDAGAGKGSERLTRALAVWYLLHPGPVPAEHVRRMRPADRRLLADGVHARRGRASPVPEHAKVFAQWPWYTPRATYTDGLLTEEDRANVALLDRPPTDVAVEPTVSDAPTAPVTPSDAPVRAPVSEVPAAPGSPGCGWGAADGSTLGALLGALGLLVARRAPGR